MAQSFIRRLSRRDVIQGSLLAGAAWTFGRSITAHGQTGGASSSLITRAIPSSGEQLPVVGLGTNAYSVTEPAEIAERRAVLERMPQLGGKVVDTAPLYGRSEEVIGEIVSGLGNRDKLFIATKVMAPNDDVARGKAQLEESLRRLRVSAVDLMQVHNLNGVDAMIPVLEDWKKAGKTRYIGITTSTENQYEQMLAYMRRHTLDFIQVDYSIANRGAAERILPLAQERKIAVLVNMPFGGRRGGNLFQHTAGLALPDWAAEIDAKSWSQVFLKYVISHPAVTCVIPGTTKVKHLEDNQQAARGRLPDADLRRRMERFWDART